MTIHPGGQNICGVSIGVLALESYFPKPPGHIKNPSSLPFTTLYEMLDGITVPKLLANPTGEMKDRLIEAAKRLEAKGVRAITGSCGFLAVFQKEIAAAVNVPVFVSSLIQVPLAHQMTGRKVGVITASAASLTEAHLRGVGAENTPVAVQGLDDAEEFSTVILRNERTAMDLAKVETELLAAARGMIARNPEIGPIVLECTDLPPYAHALQAALNRPVFDIITLSEMVHRAALRMPFQGFIT
ncbi:MULTISPECIES: aspartate/glutamate racemase family protein [Leisingera]|jgi:Asp/Glu/hydantoin racemase|uniref:aspartate/glutamate racemase family protein n=1 Tax=Leisingera TaxID=191028 RepID=UPI001152B77B|nr:MULTISPECIES: aspartate/glutamate racemase family protein [Leisingera]QDI74374.1 aspartate/glutamate racemase family protein [Leisingera aquaemixtae]UWQ47991.1 aspartate/glutamate racemase family protein [Leisingera aquaemixtae]